MTCREMDYAFASHAQGSPLSPDIVRHICECESCRRLVDLLRKEQAASGPDSSQLMRAKQMILSGIKPVTPLQPTWALRVAVLAIFLAVVAVEFALLGTAGWRLLTKMQRLAVLASLSLCAGAHADCIVQLMRPGGAIVVPPARLCAAAASILAIVFALAFQPQPDPAFIPTGIACLEVGLAFALLAGLSFWLFLRRGAVLSPELSGASAGGVAGIAGLAGLELHCPDLNVYHIVIWHLSVLVIAVSSGFAIGIVCGAVTFRAPREDRNIHA